MPRRGALESYAMAVILREIKLEYGTYRLELKAMPLVSAALAS